MDLYPSVYSEVMGSFFSSNQDFSAKGVVEGVCVGWCPKPLPKLKSRGKKKKTSPRLKFKHRDKNSMVIPIVVKHGGEGSFLY